MSETRYNTCYNGHTVFCNCKNFWFLCIGTMRNDFFFFFFTLILIITTRYIINWTNFNSFVVVNIDKNMNFYTESVHFYFSSFESHLRANEFFFFLKNSSYLPSEIVREWKYHTLVTHGTVKANCTRSSSLLATTIYWTFTCRFTCRRIQVRLVTVQKLIQNVILINTNVGPGRKICDKATPQSHWCLRSSLLLFELCVLQLAIVVWLYSVLQFQLQLCCTWKLLTFVSSLLFFLSFALKISNFVLKC